MPAECSAESFEFGTVEGRRVVAAFDGGAVTSDAGALLLGAADKAIRLVERFGGCFRDSRSQDRIEHEVATLVGQRVVGIALGYEDLVDHDRLRHDPVLAILAGKLEARRAGCAPLPAPLTSLRGIGQRPMAGKSTLNRLEHAPLGGPTRYHRIGHDAAAIERLFVALFLEAHRRPPAQIILDLDATDDPLHGHQEGRFFHGYYDGWCYLPLYVFCGRHLLAAKLRRANIDASAGAVEEVERLTRQIRARWPRTRILLRADSGFAREALMTWCERNRVDYVFGLARNARLEAAIASELAAAEATSRTTGTAARVFKELCWTTLDSWSRKRRVVGKAEWTQGGPNPRFVVTSIKAGEAEARHLYEAIYCARGEMENRIKECQLDQPARQAPAPSPQAPMPAGIGGEPTGPRQGRCAPTSSGCGFPRWPTSSFARCAASGSGTPHSPTPPAAPSASACSRLAPSSASAADASSSPWPPPSPGSPSTPWPISA
jgi:hypothetical protein